ncbi:L-histidine N(alpha)-methyltransferase [Mucilaginibacter antarcticus]|uniref:L-histidine N(Alpha)-methyltransferase n=1 Tax=Mucilaginibacter antarcticus TaxID=1855725 RepID=A0ABW5XI92_9SPHI
MNQTATPNEIMETSANNAIQTFYEDVIKGLTTTPKRLNSMYFYDAVGDKIFQELMDCPEYYPTNCELEIFKTKTAELAQTIMGSGDAFDLIELGAGDATKSSFLLKHLQSQQVNFTYLPIDISANVINYLTVKLPLTIPGLKITGLNGQYFDMMKQAAALSNRRKVVLFMGSNIGNMPVNEAVEFCKVLRNHLEHGDMAVIGFDLKKSPKTILAAYNDQGGITKRFNLNLLHRINRELDGNFDVSQFDHYATYDPETGACKSYLISQKEQTVTIGNQTIYFAKDEHIYMEISQKFTITQTDQMAASSGFKPVDRFFDIKKWFVDAIWVAE